MGKFDKNAAEKLYNAILSLKDAEECDKFFEDICTVKELQAMAQRFWVAALRRDNKNYQEIQASTGACSATISRVNKCLLYGDGGYATALQRLDEAKENTDGSNA